ENSGSAYIFRRDGTNWIEEQKLTASDGAEDDDFGGSVSISGDYAIVGAEWDDGGQGSAYIFRRNGTSWIEEQKLTANDFYFGGSVSISGDYAIIGAQPSSVGSAYIFRRDGTNWIEEQRITASDGATGDWFGSSVSISGNYAIVGAYGNDDAGSAYIYKRDGVNWIEEQKLTASDGEPNDYFGNSVSISEDYAIVGAVYDGNSHQGSAYIFRRDGASWIEEQKLTASDGEPNDEFGGSVSISGNYSIAGAEWDDDNGEWSGSAYIYSGFVVGVEEEKSGVPNFFKLVQNYPNPFNPITTINYQIPELSFVTLKVYDVLGSEIITLVNEEKSVGSYEVEFNATQLPSGIYFYILQAGSPSTNSGQSFVETKKMVLMK
ncbi:MAG: T9SS type A sorting domain-containing protein, partial [Ignavibacteria bacterium]|nr:T9SS type A sorting domain-containing protein [Ignavibacteria bacterium]